VYFTISTLFTEILILRRTRK